MGGPRRLVACAGLASLLLCAGSRALRVHRAEERAVLPSGVGRTRIAPARGFAAATIAVAVVLPLAVAVTSLAVYEWAWLAVTAVAVVGSIYAIAAGRRRSAVDEYRWPRDHELATELLQRLCMRAGMRRPDLAVEPAAVANAWTSRGRIHVSVPLIELLDRNELEAERDWAPRGDLREVCVLCIVGTGRRVLGRLLASHPPTAARVRRLEAIEARL